MLSESRYLQIVRASAWYDLAVTAAFATPWTFALMLGGLADLAQQLALPGSVPVFEAADVLMANLLGSVVIAWAILRIRHTQRLWGRYDAVLRFLFTTWQLYAVAHGASSIILAFSVFELAFGVLQSLPVRRAPG